MLQKLKKLNNSFLEIQKSDEVRRQQHFLAANLGCLSKSFLGIRCS